MFTALNTLTSAQYVDKVQTFLKQRENPKLFNGTKLDAGGVHDDGVGIPTIGYGFNLANPPVATVVHAIKYALIGSPIGPLTKLQQEGVDLVKSWRAGTISADTLIKISTTTTAGTQAQRDAMDALNLTDAQAGHLLEAFLFGEAGLFPSMEDQLSDRLVRFGASLPPPSEERIVLMSLFYNAKTLVGRGIATAIATDNHAKFWYEVRYNHGNYDVVGLQNRREIESNLVGILAPADRDDPEKALDGMDYLFDRTGANSVYKTISDRDKIINGQDPGNASLQSFEAQIKHYMDLLSTTFAEGKAIHFVQEGGAADDVIRPGEAAHLDLKAAETNDLVIDREGSNTIRVGGGDDYVITGDGNDTIALGAGGDVAKGGAGNDSLAGNQGDDTLFGEDGDDTLDGGAGADAMTGGPGEDTFVVDHRSDVILDENEGNVKTKINLTKLFDNIIYYENIGNELKHVLNIDSAFVNDLVYNYFEFFGNSSNEQFLFNFLTDGTVFMETGGGRDLVKLSGGLSEGVFIDDFATGLDTLDLSAYGASDAYDVYLQHQDDPSWFLHLTVGGIYLNAPRILNGIADEVTGSVSVIRVLGFTNGLVDAEQLVSVVVGQPWTINDIVI